MIDQELKKKIVNTISRYELKCDKMQLRIDALKNVINQLVISPIGINYELDEHLSQLKTQLDLDNEFDPKAIERKVNTLVRLINKEQKKKSQTTRVLSGLIKQGTESISRIANKSQDKKAVTKLQHMLETEIESQSILVHFNEVLTQCISSVIREMEEHINASKENDSKANTPKEISFRVNDSLQQLLNHLAVPQALDVKRDTIKHRLDNQLTNDGLSKVIDELTELVVDAFNVEQNRFKGFLQQLTSQLSDFDVFLKTSTDLRKQAMSESRQLEHGIQDNIAQIKNHLDTSTTIEELSLLIKSNLNMMGDRIREYRASEQVREKEHEKQIHDLQKKLSDSEQNADEIKNLLSFQKYKINHDSLTGLPNRESYDEHILDSFQRWKRKKKILSLAVCDIDHFKRINDSFGHLAGDKVLKKVSSILRASIREADFIARIGGEEFVIIFEETTSKAARVILEQLRKLIQDCQFYYRDNKVDVTISFGLTSIIENDSLESFFIRADNAMYKAKNAGRNRVEIL